MRQGKRYLSLPLILATAAFLGCHDETPTEPLGPDVGMQAAKGDNGGKPPGEAGNNLSYPVIWAEGVPKVLPGAYGTVKLDGEWWYSWGTTGTDPDVTPLACPPDPDDNAYCDDGVTGTVGVLPGVGGNMDLVRAYLQKDLLNNWQAFSGTPYELGVVAAEGDPLHVDWIDWGDNLESVDWYTRSQVRTEVVLFQDNPDPVGNPWLDYEMRHTSGWGIDEVHGLATTLDPVAELNGAGDRATVFSPCARFTIQLLLVDRDDPLLAGLTWVPGSGWVEPVGYPDPLINPPIFNEVVYEAGDGPGYYNAEINVKGRIIYGYTWSVRKLHDATLDQSGAGDYRLTFSFDESCGSVNLNTFFVDGTTQIMVPLEEVVAAEEGEETGGGGTAVLIPAQYDPVSGELIGGNLTYMDVHILERGGGGDGGGNGGKGGKGGGGGTGHN